MQCLQISEPEDPDTWERQLSVLGPAGTGPLDDVVSPPKTRTDVINSSEHDKTISPTGDRPRLREDNFDAITCKIKIGVDRIGKANAAYQMTFR